MSSLTFVLALFAAVSMPPEEREILTLKGGARIEGAVLKESQDTLFVDIGFTVLPVPRAEVLERKSAEATPPEGGAPAAAEDPDRLWTPGAGGSERSVRDLTAALGSSVVLVSSPAGTGSGFFINRRGMVITNFHVIEGARKISLTVFQKRGTGFEKKKVQKVSILALNATYDLALLQIDEEELKSIDFEVATLGDETRLRPGDGVFAIGNPRGLERTVTEGIISTVARAMDGLLYLQTTTQINPGNSGGPLFNLRGEVVGVTNMILLQSEGLGFAIPARRVKEFVDNREAFAFDADQPNTGHRYLPPTTPEVPHK